MTPLSTSPRGRRRWWALACLCLPVLITSMDVSVLLFALPQIARDLQPSASQQLWVLDVYGLVLSALLLPVGALGDRVGRRKLLLVGAVLFGLASLAAAWAPSAGALIGARALLGIGGATLMPSTLALVRTVFVDERERARAVAVWSGVMAGGVGLGPVLCGLLLAHAWWGSVFLVNVPVVLVLLVAVPLLVPESRAAAAPRPDLLSTALCLVAALSVVYGVQEVAAQGWSAPRALALALGAGAGGVFVHRQRTSSSPLVDPAWFSRPAFSGSVVVNTVAMGVLVGNGLLLSQYLQSVLGMSALRAALWSTAPAVVVGAVAPAAVALSAALGRSRTMAAGLLVAAAGFAVLTRTTPTSSVWLALGGAALIAAGLVAAMTLVTDAVLAAAPAERAGAVSGFLETSSELAGALGIALLGSVLTAVYRSRIADALAAAPAVPAPVRAATGDSLAGAAAAAGDSPAARAVLAAARAAYTSGMHTADLVAASALVAGAAMALLLLPVRDVPTAQAERAAAATAR